jgi:hypothetical protein
MILVGVINSLGKLVRVREPLSAKASNDPLKLKLKKNVCVKYFFLVFKGINCTDKGF